MADSSTLKEVEINFEDGTVATFCLDEDTYRLVQENDAYTIDMLYAKFIEAQDQSNDTDKNDEVTSDDSSKSPSNTEEEDNENDSTLWKREAVLLLIALVEDQYPKFSDSAYKSAAIWRHIASEMQKKGYTYGAGQCNRKFRNLKNRYKIIVDTDTNSSRGRRKWEYFEAMDHLMAGDPAVTPKKKCNLSQTKKDEEEITGKPPKAPKRDVPGSTPERGRTLPTDETTPIRSRRGSGSRDQPPQWFMAFQERQEKQFNDLKEINQQLIQVAKDRNDILSKAVQALLKK